MDNLTHGLTGALLGQAGLKRKTGLAMPALIIGANLPDVDAACFLWTTGAEHLAIRRGITHGPIAWVVLPLILAALLYSYDRWQAKRGKRPEGRLPVSFKWLYLLSFIGCLTHPALDWLNVYGIRLLEPFSSRWFYGDILFIIDVWLWALLGFATWFSLRREKRGGEWRRPARIALSAALVYIGLQASITWQSENFYSYSPVQGETVIASPMPVWSIRRELISGGNGVYAIASDVVGEKCRLPELTDRARTDRQLAAFLFWSRAPFAERAPDGSVLLRDARFYDPRARDRFTVALPDVACVELPAEAGAD